jgi:hypothetical protein
LLPAPRLPSVAQQFPRFRRSPGGRHSNALFSALAQVLANSALRLHSWRDILCASWPIRLCQTSPAAIGCIPPTLAFACAIPEPFLRPPPSLPLFLTCCRTMT